MTEMEIYGELWDDMMGLKTTEARYAYAQTAWTRHGLRAIEATSDLAASMLNQAAASRPAGTVRLTPPTAEFLAKLGDPSHHEDIALATWAHLTGRVASGQMDVEDPTLAAELGKVVTHGADVVFWFIHWSALFLHDMADRLSDDEFDKRFNKVLAEYGLD